MDISSGSGFRLETLGMKLRTDLGPGLFGQQWSVQLIAQKRDQPVFERVAEIVEVHDAELELRCENMSRLAGAVPVRGVSGLIGTEWIGDFRFAALCDHSPNARSLASLALEDGVPPLDEDGFWCIAAMLFRRIAQLHHSGFVHGALSPATLRVDDGVLIVGDLWWADAFDGRPWSRSLNPAIQNSMPDSVRRFAAPEVLRNDPASRESDFYSLGAILYFLLTGQCPPSSHEDNQTETTSSVPLTFDRESEHGPFVFNLLKREADERTNRPQLEGLLNSKMLSRIKTGFPELLQFNLTPEYGPGLYGILPDQVMEIIDLHHNHVGSMQIECRHEKREAWFQIEGLLRTCGRTYLALSDSPDFSEGLKSIPFSVVCMMDDWHFRVLTPNEFRSVQEDMTESISLGTGRSVDYAQFLLGPIRAWA